jgi:hypothetical protein
VDALIDIDPHYPTIDGDARAQLVKAKSELEAQAPKGAAPDPVTPDQAT